MQPTLIVRRVIYAPLTLLGICTLVFFLIRALPGGPIAYYRGQLGSNVSQEVLREMARTRRLDRSLPSQYVSWLHDLIRLDLGYSYLDHRPVIDKIAERLPKTLLLNGVALAVSTFIALPLGLYFGSRRRFGETLTEGGLLLLFSLPTFWLALLLMEWMAVRWRLLPLYGMSSDDAPLFEQLRYMVMPVICLSATQIAIIARFTRSSLETTMNEDHVRAARARGVGEASIVIRHGLRNILVPLISLLGVMLPYLLSGSVVIERIFQWNGAGQLLFDAVIARDYPTIMGLTLVTAMLVLLVTTLTDLFYVWADPRVRSAS